MMAGAIIHTVETRGGAALRWLVPWGLPYGGQNRRPKFSLGLPICGG